MDLSRRLRERRRQGSFDDALAHLQARLRGGELQPVERAAALLEALTRGALSWERVELAGYLGDPLARELVGVEALVALASYLDPGSGAVNVIVDQAPDWDDLEAWAQALAHWGRRAVAWALLGGTRVAVAAAARQEAFTDPDDPYVYEDPAAVAAEVGQRLDAVEAWLRADVGGRPRDDPVGYWPLARAANQVLAVCGRAPLDVTIFGWVTTLRDLLDTPAELRAGMARLAAPWALGEPTA